MYFLSCIPIFSPLSNIRLFFDAIILFFTFIYWLYIPLHFTFKINLFDIFGNGFASI